MIRESHQFAQDHVWLCLRCVDKVDDDMARLIADVASDATEDGQWNSLGWANAALIWAREFCDRWEIV